METTRPSLPSKSPLASDAVPGTVRAPPGARRQWRRAAYALLAIALVAAAWVAWERQAQPAKEYLTEAVDTGTVAPTVIASGTVNPVNTIQVGTYVSGVIQMLACDFNTRVRAGQLCAKLDPRPYQSVVDQETASLAIANAQLQKDRATLALAKLVNERNVELLRRSIVSQETADTAATAYAQAQSQILLDQAAILQRQAALNAARTNLGYTNIVSPVDGTVVSRNVTQGQTVAASFQTPTLFLIATDLTKMQVDINVSESDIGRVGVGNAASFTVEAFPNRSFHGSVKQVRQAPQTVQNVITYDVVVGVDNAAGLLMPGMTASARIVTQRHDNVLRVPVAALRYMPTGLADRAPAGARKPPRGAPPEAGGGGRAAQVWVLQANQPQRRSVMLGLDDEIHAEILQGQLRAGDAVITAERGPGGQAHANGAPPAGASPALPRLPRR